MERINLKQLKELLNKLPEKNLDKYAITNDLFIEDPTGEISVCYIGDEGDSELMSLYELKEYKQLKDGFIKYLNKDVEKCILFRLGVYGDTLEIADEEPDWETD